MTDHLPSVRRARGEEGVALAWALAFMVLVGVVVFFVLGYADTSVQSTTRLSAQRSAAYSVDGAVNNAIRYVQNSTNGGAAGNPASCALNDTGLNGLNVQVTCVPAGSSGVATPPSSAPPFAILTLAPFTHFWDAHGYSGGGTYPGCSSVSTDANAELGIVQVQNDKALTVNGDVFVNSDVDADTWTNHCPNISAARAIQVNGNAVVKESCHDLFAAAGATPPNGWYCDQNGSVDFKTQADAGRSPNGAYTSAPAGLLQNLVDPAVASPASWAPAITTAPPAQSVPACPAGKLVTFTPGTYTDAAALTSLMNGTTCPGRLFWFQPGNYYFNFPNGSDTWTVNDGAARIVGGTANAVASGAMPVGPVTVAAKNPPAPTTGASSGGQGYTNPTNAVVLGETPTAASATTGNFTTSNQTRWITTGGYAISPAVPGGASGLSVSARIVHSETFGNPSQIGALQLLVRDVGDTTTLCSVNVPPSATSGANTDVTVLLPNGCLDAAALNAGSFVLRYQIAHSGCGNPTPACANVSSSLDGVQLKVSYTAPARAAWSPSDPTTVTAASPTVPGACIHDGDYGFGPATGVQFVFGGSSHVVLKSGAWELCPSFSSTHQEIVLYGVRSLNGASPQTVTLTPAAAAPGSGSTWTPTSPNTTYGQAKLIDGSTVSTSVSGNSPATRTFQLSGFTPPTPIPAGSTNVSVTARVAHRESSTSRFDSQQITLTPASGTGCTVGLNDSTSLTPETPGVNCLDVGELNSGVSITYSVRYNCSSSCSTTRTAELDGVELVVTYTPPATTGSLTPASGCITQIPYYSPIDHSPAYSGACALFSVASNGNGGASPRVAVFWGTVYAPSAALDVPVDVLTVPVFDRGVVARMLMLGYNVSSNAQVPISSTPITANVANNRRMTFTATIPGKSTQLVADVEFCDSACDGTHGAGTTKVWSWTVTR